MLYKISERLADRLLIKGAIIPENKDIYVYGLQLFISFLFSSLSIILIGLLIGKLLVTTTFLIIYILLRSYSGGYHANSYIACFAITISVYLAVLLFTELLSVNCIAFIILLFSGIILLYIFAPIQNIHKRVLAKDRNKYRIISICLFCLFVVLGMVLSIYNPILGNAVFYTLCADLINMLPNCLRRNSIKDKEEE